MPLTVAASTGPVVYPRSPAIEVPGDVFEYVLARMAKLPEVASGIIFAGLCR